MSPLAFALVSCHRVTQEKADDALDKAKVIAEKYIAEKAGTGIDFRIEVVSDKYVRETFPQHVFVAVTFPQWPVPDRQPEAMKPQNLFAVTETGNVMHLGDSQALEELFKSTLGPKLDKDKTARS
jgi:hypothetical protein